MDCGNYNAARNGRPSLPSIDTAVSASTPHRLSLPGVRNAPGSSSDTRPSGVGQPVLNGQASPTFLSQTPSLEARAFLKEAEDSQSVKKPNPCKPTWRDRRKQNRKRTGMAEPRARAARHKGTMNFPNELRLLLLAYGDPSPHSSFPTEPLPETVRVLDEIVTDFILEMCHEAAAYANYSRRQKIKVDDFRFALRRDPGKLGRVQELLRMERELKEARKVFDQNDDQVGALKEAGKRGLEDDGESVGTAGPGPSKKAKTKTKKNVRRVSS